MLVLSSSNSGTMEQFPWHSCLYISRAIKMYPTSFKMIAHTHNYINNHTYFFPLNQCNRLMQYPHTVNNQHQNTCNKNSLSRFRNPQYPPAITLPFYNHPTAKCTSLKYRNFHPTPPSPIQTISFPFYLPMSYGWCNIKGYSRHQRKRKRAQRNRKTAKGKTQSAVTEAKRKKKVIGNHNLLCWSNNIFGASSLDVYEW